MNKINWEQRTRDTLSLSKSAKTIVQSWLDSHPDWTGHIAFHNYPPRLEARFEIIHINILSDLRLAEIGELVTQICNELHLVGKKHPIRPCNLATYKFTLPFE